MERSRACLFSAIHGRREMSAVGGLQTGYFCAVPDAKKRYKRCTDWSLVGLL